MRKISILFILLTTVFLQGCQKEKILDRFGIFQVLNDSTVIMDGVIRTRTFNKFDQMTNAYPGIKQIIMKNVPGSMDDEINLLISRKVHEMGMHTVLDEGASIQSGGTDFFLAGHRRTSRNGSFEIGVHSWSDRRSEATDYPKGHELHGQYIQYFVDIGFDQDWSEAFYYFTIYAAASDEIHIMTKDEITQYGIFTH